MGRKRKKDGVIFSVYISKDLYNKLRDKKYSQVSKSDLVEEALRFILSGHDEIFSLTRELKILKDKIKELEAELDRLKRENAELKKKLEKYEVDGHSDGYLSAKEKRIRSIIKSLENHIGKRYEDAIFELAVSEDDKKEILWNYFKEEKGGWLVTSVADIVIDVRTALAEGRGWFGGIIRHKSEYNNYTEEQTKFFRSAYAGVLEK